MPEHHSFVQIALDLLKKKKSLLWLIRWPWACFVTFLNFSIPGCTVNVLRVTSGIVRLLKGSGVMMNRKSFVKFVCQSYRRLGPLFQASPHPVLLGIFVLDLGWNCAVKCLLYSSKHSRQLLFHQILWAFQKDFSNAIAAQRAWRTFGTMKTILS